MDADKGADDRVYKVVVNDEQQYSIWPAERENPAGWTDAGMRGAKDECLENIKTVWTDMRPLSLRRALDSRAGRASSPLDSSAPAASEPLVHRLSRGVHQVEVVLRREPSAQALEERIHHGYVQLRFRDTHGGTEVGCRLVHSASNLQDADFARAMGTVHLVGRLTLDDVDVTCVADIDLSTLAGTGCLQLVGPVDGR